MSVTKQNPMRHELIGLEARVVNSSDPTLVGIHGKIVDETRDMLVVEQAGKDKIIPKSSSTFLIAMSNGKGVTVEGKKLIGRPEERVRRKR
ncbi:MAG: ribonuclease P protein component 1 [Candidatus Hodarchaeaceae archaeon]|nr:ribonuclease P protein component 1 [Candidatus Hodarchaeaceae archaeon]MDI6883636.1 ribonuclease P protein component 1 [Hadesarchaea archaeon]